MSLRTLVPLFLLSGFCVVGAAACGPQSSLATEVSDATAADAADAKEDSAHKDLTAAQKKTVLVQLNNICGDTWCDGDWAFDFLKVTCKLDLGTCTWTALIQPSVPVAKPVPVYWRSCKVSGVHKLADLVTTTNGHQSLNQEYYSASTDCVFKIEPKLPSYTPLP